MHGQKIYNYNEIIMKLLITTSDYLINKKVYRRQEYIRVSNVGILGIRCIRRVT